MTRCPEVITQPSPAPGEEPGRELVQLELRPSAPRESGARGRWWGGVHQQRLGGRSWRAVWRRAPRRAGATSRPPALPWASPCARRPHVVISPWAVLQLFLTTSVTTISARYPFPTPTQTVAGADHGRRGASYEAIEPIQVAAPADGSRAHKQCLPDRHSPATRHRPAPQRSQRVQRAVWLERVRVLFARSHIPAACLALFTRSLAPRQSLF